MNLFTVVTNSYSSWTHFSDAYPLAAKATKTTLVASLLGLSFYWALKRHPVITTSCFLFLASVYYYCRKQTLPETSRDDRDAFSILEEQDSATKKALSLLEKDVAISPSDTNAIGASLGIKSPNLDRFRFLPTNFPKNRFPTHAQAIERRKERFWQILQQDNPTAYSYLFSPLNLRSS
jgi:hypothetical protein